VGVLSADVTHLHSGKVRDLYAIDDDLVLVVASDRISAFDHVLSTPIPDKGVVLTQLSLWWFSRLADLMPNHVVTADIEEYPAGLRDQAPMLRGRSMLCRRLSMVPVEAVARGYLAGSGWASYKASGTVVGHELPPGLTEGGRLPEAIFTPTTKAPVGEHDEPLTFEGVVALVGAELAERLRDLTLSAYEKAHAVALARGLVVADTKLEFGQDQAGALTLADEVLTPDSSRFWPAAFWSPGGSQPSFDKQYVRDWLVSDESGWSPDSGKPPPPLPPDVVGETRAKYLEAYRLLTGEAVPYL
jgi:phosphoribosylaminoimidazole-succinocarboxamide synthase